MHNAAIRERRNTRRSMHISDDLVFFPRSSVCGVQVSQDAEPDARGRRSRNAMPARKWSSTRGCYVDQADSANSSPTRAGEDARRSRSRSAVRISCLGSDVYLGGRSRRCH